MAKKRGKKKTSKRKTTTKRISHPNQKIVIQQAPAPKESKVDAVLIENFVSLQRVLTNLSIKLDNVATQMTKLLDLFEISAKALAEKDFDLKGDSKEVLEKLDTVLDQNKTLARGLTLMHERVPPMEMYQQQPPMRPLPPMPKMPQSPPQNFQSPVIQQRQEIPQKRELGPSRTFAKEIEEEPELEPPQFESPL